MKFKFFISYSATIGIGRILLNDFIERLKIHNNLINKGEILWDQNMKGRDYNEVIEGYIQSCHIAILLVNSKFIQSEYCFKELEALKKRKDVTIIPIYFQACDYIKWNNEIGGHLPFFPAKMSDYRSARSTQAGSDHENSKDVSYGAIKDDEDRELYHTKLKEWIDNRSPLSILPSSSGKAPQTLPLYSAPRLSPKESIYENYMNRCMLIQTGAGTYSNAIIVGRENIINNKINHSHDKEVREIRYYILYIRNPKANMDSIVEGNEDEKIIYIKKIGDINEDNCLVMAVIRSHRSFEDSVPSWEGNWDTSFYSSTQEYVVIGSTKIRKYDNNNIARFYIKAGIKNSQCLEFHQNLCLSINQNKMEDTFDNLDSRVKGAIVYNIETMKAIGIIVEKIGHNEFDFFGFDSKIVEEIKNSIPDLKIVEQKLLKILEKPFNQELDKFNYLMDDPKEEKLLDFNSLSDDFKPIISAYYFNRREFLEETFSYFLSNDFRKKANCFLSTLKDITRQIPTTNNIVQFKSRLVITFLLLECIKKHFEPDEKIVAGIEDILKLFLDYSNVGEILFLSEHEKKPGNIRRTEEMIKQEESRKEEKIKESRETLYKLLPGPDRNTGNSASRLSLVVSYFNRLIKNEEIHADVPVILVYLTLQGKDRTVFFSQADFSGEKRIKRRLETYLNANSHRPLDSAIDEISYLNPNEFIIQAADRKKKTGEVDWLTNTKFYYKTMVKLEHWYKIKRVYEFF